MLTSKIVRIEARKGEGIFGPDFFKNDDSATLNVNDEHYRIILTD